MTEQSQAVAAKPEKKNPAKTPPVEIGLGADQSGEASPLVELGALALTAAAGDAELKAQAARLADRRLHTAQRRALAAYIGRAQGNSHFYQVVQRMPAPALQRQAPANAAPATTAAITPAPAGTDASAQGLSPEDARRLIFARTTLNNVPPLAPGDQKTLESTIKDSTAYATLEQRNKKREELKKATDDFEEAKRDLQDVNGVPPKEMVDKKDALGTQVKALGDDVTDLDKTLQAILKSLNTTEDQLVKLVTEDFPNLFVSRGKQIALQELKQNKELAQKEKDQYLDICTEDSNDPVAVRNGLRSAAQDLVKRQKDIEEDQLKIQEAHKDQPAGGKDDSANQSSSAYDLAHEQEINDRIAQHQKELKSKRNNYALKYKILYRDDVDIEKLATASDAELEAIVGSKVDEVLDNITDTEDNINNNKIKIWALKDIVSMTRQSLGIEKNQTLLAVVDRYIQQARDEQAGASEIETALKALAMTAAIVASVATLNPGIAIGVGAVIGVIDVIESATSNERRSAASDVALDQAVSKMSKEEPEWIWLIAAIASLVLDAVALGTVFKEMKAASSTLEAFTKAAYRALPEAQAKELVDIARTQIRPFMNIAGQLESIGAGFSKLDRVKVGALLARYSEDAYTAAFLQLSAEQKIMPMTEDAIRQVIKNKDQADALVAEYINNPKKVRGGFYEPSTKTVFVKDTSTAGLGGVVVHELTHEFQRTTEVAISYTNQVFYAEFQAHLAQQQFLEKVVADYGIDVVPQTSRWLVNADDETIATKITQRYGVKPDPELGLVRITQEDLIKQMVDKRLPMIERRKQFLERMQQKVQ
jgi:hypothetical protein